MSFTLLFEIRKPKKAVAVSEEQSRRAPPVSQNLSQNHDEWAKKQNLHEKFYVCDLENRNIYIHLPPPPPKTNVHS